MRPQTGLHSRQLQLLLCRCRNVMSVLRIVGVFFFASRMLKATNNAMETGSFQHFQLEHHYRHTLCINQTSSFLNKASDSVCVRSSEYFNVSALVNVNIRSK